MPHNSNGYTTVIMKHMNENRLTCPTCTFYMDMLLERSGKIVILEHNF